MACLHTMMLNVQDLWDQQLRLILGEIARDHQLDSRRLIGKYILRGMPDLSPVTLQTYPEAQKPVVEESQHPPEIPEPRKAPAPQGPKKKGGRKPKFQEKPNLEGELTEEYLQSLTIPLIKEACKMRKIAISGGKDVLIKRFLEYQKDPEAHKPPRKGGRKKKSQEPEPQHNHTLDDKTHEDCDQCKVYGNPMDPKMSEEEFEIDQNIQNQLKEIVGKMNATTLDEPEESEKPYDVFGLQDTKEASDDEAEWEEYQEPQDDEEDPYAIMEYGDDLTFED
jgi:hypothetical protein